MHMEFVAKDEIKAIVDHALTLQLKQRGFKKRAFTWHKGIGDISQVVNVQLGRFNDRHESNFTLNVGCYHEQFHIERGLVPVTSTLKEYDCDVRVRIGELMGDRDNWWTVAYNKNNEKVRDGFKYNVDQHVWGWLDDHREFTDFYDFFIANNRFFDAAVAAYILGMDNIDNLLDSALKTANRHFRPTVERWARKRGFGG